MLSCYESERQFHVNISKTSFNLKKAYNLISKANFQELETWNS